jgi:hypothetical protein
MAFSECIVNLKNCNPKFVPRFVAEVDCKGIYTFPSKESWHSHHPSIFQQIAIISSLF